jgi:Phosphatidylinositol 3- and 4-kinase
MLPDQKETILKILQEGSLSLRGEFMWGSNYTFLVEISHPDQTLQAVYKPTRGVRPLWDFASPSLARREVAAYLVSESLGWELVPPTLYRKNGPYGAGSIQLYIDHDPEYHYFNFNDTDKQRLRKTSLFDLLINNADRKGSHILIDPEEHIWLIDHGISFHIEPKLRTVVWDFAGESFPPELCQDLSKLIEQLKSDDDTNLAIRLSKHLSAAEIRALNQRAEQLVAAGRYPNPDPDRRPYPWPPV